MTITACATDPGLFYKPSRSATGVGYSEKPISLEQYFVTFRAPRVVGQKTVENFALLRAAELTQEKGHPWFKLIAHETAEVEVARPKSVTINTADTNFTCSQQKFGCSYQPSYADIAGGNVTTSGGVTTQIVCTLQIAFGVGPKPEGSNVYDAKATAERLRASLTPAK